MRNAARISVLGALLLVAGCGVPIDAGNGTSTTVPLAAPEDPVMEIISVTACKQSDPWTMVETAFEGTVTAIEPRDNPDRQVVAEETGATLGEETWQWVSFDVSSWYTTDFGTEFAMWAPNFEGAVGETWLIGGALYGSMGQQSGEVFPCVSELASDGSREAWADRYGSPVPAGAGVPESEPDPSLTAEIEEHQAEWLAAGIDDYTAVISLYEGSGFTDSCGSNSAIRVTVVDGVVTQAFDVMQFCVVDDLSTAPTIDKVFAAALASAGAITEPVEYDDDLGFIRSFYASDRSVEVSAYVEMFQLGVTEAVLGTELSMAAAETASSTWNAGGIDDYTYTLDVICFCTISGRFQVTVADGEVVEVTSADTGAVDLESPDNFMTYDVEGLFALVDDWGGQTADNMLAAFDPELGYPVEIRIDSITNAIDDELTFFVSDFEAAD